MFVACDGEDGETNAQPQASSEISSQLSSPVLSNGGKYMTWNVVANADYYEIYVSGELYTTTTSTQYKISGSTFYDKTITVRACSNKNSSLNSVLSNSIVGTVA